MIRFVLALTAALAQAADWPQFRGPNGSATSPDTGLPVEFGPAKNVVWKTALPPGQSSPILSGNRIFVTAYEGEKMLAIALDRATGRVLWTRETLRPRRENFQKTHGPASPTPAADGERVYVFFGDYGLIAYGFDGDEKWRVPLGPFNNVNGHGTSPIVAGELVVLVCDQDTGSFVIAVDRRTGKVRWKIDRPEVTRGYSTPGVLRPRNGPAELIVPGAYQLIGYDLETGKKLWWVGGFSWQLKASPVIDGDMIYINGWETSGDFEQAPDTPLFEELLARHDADRDGRISIAEAPANLKRWFVHNDLDQNGVMEARDWSFYRNQRAAQNNVTAIRHGGRGDLTGTNVVWRYRRSVPNVPSPVVYQGVVYLVKEGGILTALNPKTGELYKQARLEGALDRYWASPVAADGKVYVLSESGKLVVLKADPQWRILAVNDLEEEGFATPAIADRRLYVRVRTALYAFGQSR